jgi:hypothetical protein
MAARGKKFNGDNDHFMYWLYECLTLRMTAAAAAGLQQNQPADGVAGWPRLRGYSLRGLREPSPPFRRTGGMC